MQPGSTVGRYVIRKKLAEGGMAEIFLASAVGPEGFAKDVVIKVVKSFLAKDQQFVQMFIAEARLASKLNHANVVQIFDFGKHGESYYLAMEFVRGASLWDLRKRCRDHKVPFPPTLAAEIGAQVARGLQYAHGLTEAGQRIGVVHRDVTPHNVLLSFDGAVKLTDFGIAKATTQHTAPGMLKGKFAYMSPEQSRGEKVDARTDIFALGIVLWELLTGGRLFDGDSDLAVLRAVQDCLIPPPSRMNPDVPQELSDVVMKALARPLDERFQTAFELDRALANFVLRNAKSVEDSSVAMFLQQLFKEEFDAPLDGAAPDQTLSPDDDFGVGNTVARPGLLDKAQQTMTATPVGPPQPAPGKVSRLPVKTEQFEGQGPPPMARAAKTEQFEVGPSSKPGEPPRAKTEQMPALKRAPSSRRFDPLPVQEPSVVVRPSAQQLPSLNTSVSGTPTASASVTETDDAREALSEPVQVPRSNTPIIAVLSVLVAVLLGGVWFVTREPAPAATPAPPVEVAVAPTPAPAEVATPPVEDVKPEAVAKPPEPEKPAPAEAPEVDAGAVAKVEAPKPEVKAPVAVARKTGTLTIKAVPFATVTVQGKSYEVMGVKSVTAPAGTYDILLKHPKKQAKQQVTVPANGSATVTFSAD